MSISTKPVKGTRDFDPVDAALREHVKSVILQSYLSYGFNQIETPVMENIELLQNAEGGENLNMLFKVLKRGEKLKLDKPVQHENDLVDYGLRFDLTLPLARFYANNHAHLPRQPHSPNSISPALPFVLTIGAYLKHWPAIAVLVTTM